LIIEARYQKWQYEKNLGSKLIANLQKEVEEILLANDDNNNEQ